MGRTALRNGPCNFTDALRGNESDRLKIEWLVTLEGGEESACEWL